MKTNTKKRKPIKKPDVEKMVRLGARVTVDQFNYIKKLAKKNNFTEGETVRMIIKAFKDCN